MKYSIYFCMIIFFCTNSEESMKIRDHGIQDGIIEYAFVPNEVSAEDKQKNKELYGFLENINKAANDLIFILKFNSEESVFNLESQMASDSSPLIVSYAENVITKGTYYYNRKQDILLRKSKVHSKNNLIKSQPSLIKWELNTKTKKIDGYNCYNATREKKIRNKTGTYEFLIEAWYTPQIPVPYGPNEFNGLPGLILELKDTHNTFYVKNIKLGMKQKIIAPTAKNMMTETEFENMLKNKN